MFAKQGCAFLCPTTDFPKAKDDGHGNKIINVAGVCWFANIEHGGRHELLQLDTMAHNLKYNKRLRKKLETEYGVAEYPRYDNYDAMEVPFTECIPSDYDGVMGVPITFMDKYCPEQFAILGMCENEDLYDLKTRTYSTAECKNAYLAKFGKTGTYDLNASGVISAKGLKEKVYQRILIRPKKGGDAR